MAEMQAYNETLLNESLLAEEARFSEFNLVSEKSEVNLDPKIDYTKIATLFKNHSEAPDYIL